MAESIARRDSFVADEPARAEDGASAEKAPSVSGGGPEERKRRWKKRGIVAGAVVLGVYVLYVIAFNLAFATGFFTWAVNRATPDFQMEFGSAWTLVPGRAHVKDCTLRVEDSNLQFYMILPDSIVDVDPFAFFGKRVHFRHARAKDVRYWFRQKVSEADMKDAKLAQRVALFPKIPGFSDVPLAPPGPKHESSAEEIAKLWSVELDDTEGTVSELWFDEYHYRGNAHVDGKFRLDPLRRLDIDATRLELRGGELSVGPDTIAKDVVGSLKITVPSLDVSKLELAALLHATDVRFELSTSLLAVPLSLYADDVARVGPGGGRLEIAVGLVKGAPTPGSRLSFDVDAVCQKAPVELRGGAQVHAQVREDGRADVIARVPAATVLIGDAAGKTAFSVRGVEVQSRFGLPKIDEPTFEGGNVIVASADAPDLKFLSRFLGPEVPRGGRLHASFRGAVDAGFAARGHLVASARDVDLTFTGARIGGAVDVSGAFASGARLSGGRFTNARITAPRVSLSLPGVPAREAALRGTAQELAWTGLVPRTLAARAFVEGNDSRILTAIVEKEEGVEAMAARSLVGNAPFSAGGSIYVADGVVRARIGRAVAGKVSVTGGLLQRKAGLDAAFLLRALGLSIGLGVEHGEVSVKPLKSAEWLDEQLGRLGLLAPQEQGKQGTD